MKHLFKKIGTFGLGCLLSLTLFTGCSSSETKEEKDSDATGEPTMTIGGVDLDNLGPVLQEIYDRGSVIVGNDSSYPPFGFIDTETNEAIGVEKEMGQAIADRLTEVLGKKIKLDFQSMDFNAVLSSLSAGDIDLVCSCCTITPERLETMDFSYPYLQTQDVFLILKENKDKYKSFEDFKNVRLAANTGSSQEVRAKTISSSVTSTPTVSDAILQLQSGSVDAIVVDNLTGERYLAKNDNLSEVTVPDSDVPQVDKGVAMQKGNEDLKAIVNSVVNELVKKGQVEKWVKEYSEKAEKMGLES